MDSEVTLLPQPDSPTRPEDLAPRDVEVDAGDRADDAGRV